MLGIGGEDWTARRIDLFARNDVDDMHLTAGRDASAGGVKQLVGVSEQVGDDGYACAAKRGDP